MGKAKDGSECYTRQNKSGGAYVTCEGIQKKRVARSKLKSGGEPPVMTKKPKKPKADSEREKAKRRAKARKLTTRPPGRIDTDGPRNVGIVDKSKPPPKPKPKAKAMSEGQKVIAALYPWQRNKTLVERVKKYEPPLYGSGPVLSEDAVKKFNSLNNVPKNPKKYLVADIQGKKPDRFVGAQNELIRVIDEEKRDKNKIKVTFHQFDTWEKALEYIAVLKKVSVEEQKQYEPLSKAQKARIAKMTAKNGVAITPQNNQSFKYGFGVVEIAPWAYSMKKPELAIVTAQVSLTLADINYKKKKK